MKRCVMVAFILPTARDVDGLRSTSVPFSRCMMKSPAARPRLETSIKSSMERPPDQAGKTWVSGGFWRSGGEGRWVEEKGRERSKTY